MQLTRAMRTGAASVQHAAAHRATNACELQVVMLGLQQIVDRQDLMPGQRGEIERILDEIEPLIGEACAEASEYEHALTLLCPAEADYPVRVGQLSARLGRVTTQVTLLIMAMKARIYEVLQPEQRRSLSALWPPKEVQ